MLPKRPVASTLVYVLVIFLISVKLHMNQYIFVLSKSSDSGRHFVSLLFCPVNCSNLIGSLCVPLFINQSECSVFFLFFALNYPFFALNYLISASYFLKTALLLANQNREIFVCILLKLL